MELKSTPAMIKAVEAIPTKTLGNLSAAFRTGRYIPLRAFINLSDRVKCSLIFLFKKSADTAGT
jgi:hypothetical protein